MKPRSSVTESRCSKPALRTWPATCPRTASTARGWNLPRWSFVNSVIGARTNTEGRESTSVAMLTGKIPDWGFHRDERRHGTHLVQVDVPVESVMDWGLLGYFIGDAVQENIPVVT